MAEASLGLKECVSIALGGMIGGGIFAVLGVVAQIARGATWAAFVAAGIVAMCAGYAFVQLNASLDVQGGAVSYVQSVVGNSTAAGMAGWTLLFGYVGSMAMYAYAFGSFTVGLGVVPESVMAVPMRPVISVTAVAGFVGLNLLGATATGEVENLLVGAKVAILLAFGIGGVWYGAVRSELVYGIGRMTSFSPIVAAGISFVAFQGWQLLFYDQESIADPIDTIRRAVYISIGGAVALYCVVAITTVSLAPLSVIEAHPERALAVAADPFIPYGFVLISLAALFSTGSAINATLFSTGHFAKGMLSEDLLPDQLGDAQTGGVPSRTIVVVGGAVGLFTAIGTLSAITTFASLTFIVIFGTVCYLAIVRGTGGLVARAIPVLGLVGSAGFFVLMVRHLYLHETNTFYAVLTLAVGALLIETLYFERETLVDEIESIESELEDAGSSG